MLNRGSFCFLLGVANEVEREKEIEPGGKKVVEVWMKKKKKKRVREIIVENEEICLFYFSIHFFSHLQSPQFR